MKPWRSLPLAKPAARANWHLLCRAKQGGGPKDGKKMLLALRDFVAGKDTCIRGVVG
jgi:hypothetical protein